MRNSNSTSSRSKVKHIYKYRLYTTNNYGKNNAIDFSSLHGSEILGQDTRTLKVLKG